MTLWFDSFETFMEKYRFGTSQVWNMDEASFQLGKTSKQWSKVPLDEKEKLTVNEEKKEYMSILETTSGNDEILTLPLLYKGQDTLLSR